MRRTDRQLQNRSNEQRNRTVGCFFNKLPREMLNYFPDDITAEHRTRLAAALTPLFGSDAVVWTQDAAQLDQEQSLDLMAWIARTLVEATIRDP